MNIIAVDDEELALQNILGLIQQVEPSAVLTGFDEVENAFAYLSNNKVDIAFLDIELNGYSGIELAKKCKQLCPQVNIIFVTGYSQYTMDAFKLHASGYLMKPVRASDLIAEFEHLRHPMQSKEKKRMQIQTFGYFEIFVDGVPLKFTRAKCKECLAYLVYRKGARVTYPDLSAVLWQDRPNDRAIQNNTQRIVTDLMKTLKIVGLQEIIYRSRQDIAIIPALVDCDYFRVIDGELQQMKTFAGEFMANYEWAEDTVGELLKLRQSKI